MNEVVEERLLHFAIRVEQQDGLESEHLAKQRVVGRRKQREDLRGHKHNEYVNARMKSSE